MSMQEYWDERARVLEAGGEILETCVAAGGVITGEHGVGYGKIDFLVAEQLAHAVRTAFGILDPAFGGQTNGTEDAIQVLC